MGSRKVKRNDGDKSYDANQSESKSEKKHKKRHKHKHRKEEHRSSSPDERPARSEKPRQDTQNEREEGSRKREGRDRRTDNDGQKKSRHKSPSPIAREGAENLSLSIGETNKLRAKLGLKPLEVGEIADSSDDASSSTKKKILVDGKEHEWYETENWGQKKEADKIREKLVTQKDRRKIMDKLSQVKGLGDADSDDPDADNPLNWVKKSRKLEDEQKAAEAREKILSEMDEEFGISDIVDEPATKSKSNVDTYSGRHLVGLTVEHSVESFKDTSDSILVLKDKDILDEDQDDVLVNPKLLDEEVWRKNTELRKKKKVYNPYEEELDALTGMPKVKDVLSKYDEELSGVPTKESFTIEPGGKFDTSHQKALARMKADLEINSQSLEMPSLKLAKEFYTDEEMVKFKKPTKKLKKMRKRQQLKADDLLFTDGPTDNINQHVDKGSRQSRIKSESTRDGEVDNDADAEPFKFHFDEHMEAPEEDLSNIVIEEDDLDRQLQAALEKARRKNVETMQRIAPEEHVLSQVVTVKKEEDEMDTTDFEEIKEERVDIVLDSISEYCRGLGDMPTYGSAGNRMATELKEMDDLKVGGVKRERRDSNSSNNSMDSKGINVGNNSSDDDVDEPGTSKDNHRILEEPNINHPGVMAALQLALQKGYVEKEKYELTGPGKLAHMAAQRFTEVDRLPYDADDKFTRKLERMGTGGGPTTDFKELREYEPDFKLEYVDETGRDLSRKEAFQRLSWKFHGKTPGKKKVGKLLQRSREQQLIRDMSSHDTPLNTLEKQRRKQEQMQTPYIMLSGHAAVKDLTALSKDKE